MLLFNSLVFAVIGSVSDLVKSTLWNSELTLTSKTVGVIGVFVMLRFVDLLTQLCLWYFIYFLVMLQFDSLSLYTTHFTETAMLCVWSDMLSAANTR